MNHLAKLTLRYIITSLMLAGMLARFVLASMLEKSDSLLKWEEENHWTVVAKTR